MEKNEKTIAFPADEISVLRRLKLIRHYSLYEKLCLILDNKVIESLSIPNDISQEVNIQVDFTSVSTCSQV